MLIKLHTLVFAGIETKFAGSSCNDLVTMDSAGTVVFSGHFDHKIRMWDNRSDMKPKVIEVQGRVTSLDLSRGKAKCSRIPFTYLF